MCAAVTILRVIICVLFLIFCVYTMPPQRSPAYSHEQNSINQGDWHFIEFHSEQNYVVQCTWRKKLNQSGQGGKMVVVTKFFMNTTIALMEMPIKKEKRS